MLISITAGKDGSWSWDGFDLIHHIAYESQVVSTAGAGVSHLVGIIVGLVAGLVFSQAAELGSLVAALSVSSPHTIHPHIDRIYLLNFSKKQGIFPEVLSKYAYEARNITHTSERIYTTVKTACLVSNIKQ